MRRKLDRLALETRGAEEFVSCILKVEEMPLRFEHGHECQYRRVRGFGAGAVLIIPVLNGNIFLLIRECLAGVHRYALQLPKGKGETGESFYEAAKREFKEEVGMGGRSLERMNTLTIAPGFMAHGTPGICMRKGWRVTSLRRWRLLHGSSVHSVSGFGGKTVRKRVVCGAVYD